MATRVAINGFGRIGRLFFRALHERNFFDGAVEVVAVNDVVPAGELAYLLKYDSMQGNMDVDVTAEGEDTLVVGDLRIKSLAEKKHPRDLPWGEIGVDVVVESTGLFRKQADAQGHIDAGAKRVVISAPSEDGVTTLIKGINHDTYNGEDAIISNASCTTNCLAPIVHVLLKEGFGVEEGLMTTIHSYTSDQVLVDGPHKDPRRGRAAAQNIIPTSSGAAIAVTQVFPELEGKLTGMAFRVPTAASSVVDFNVRTSKATSMKEINAALKNASETYLKGVLAYTEEPVVSSDFIHDAHSSIYDATAGIELNSNFFKLVSWYDNEWGYSNRLAEVVAEVCSKGL
ncbi:MAG: type I glyceraldehyde-3-phosphate dehydrogenase [Candidatus Dojkabacteria bacterium]